MTASIRPYEPDDARQTSALFRRAVAVTAAADYSAEQIAAWVASADDEDTWARRRAAAETWTAERDGAVVGFTDLDPAGHIDMMFVDPTAARTGVATALLAHVRDLAAQRGITELTVDASATARPFFERHGFTVVAAQQPERNGVVLSNFRMSGPVAPGTDEG